MARIQQPKSTVKVAVYDNSAFSAALNLGLILISLVVLLITMAT